MSSDIVVIGGGMAGARLARQLPGATVIGEETHAPYNRVLLAEVLAGRYGPEVAALPSAEVRRGVRVVRIDRADRVVQCDDGSVVPYSTLVLATGSNPVLPPLRGLPARELPDGVHPFRTMDDCLALDAAVREGTRAVVIGGGLLGVSAARALAARGARVVLAQQGERLMERQLDPAASALLRDHIEALGVEVHTECRVRGLHSDNGGAVRAVELADGYELAAEIVVLACGVRPRVGLAQAAGLDVRRGIVVDDQLRTSDPHIRAVGDCAEHNGTVYGLAGPALEQADVLAALLKDAPATDTPTGTPSEAPGTGTGTARPGTAAGAAPQPGPPEARPPASDDIGTGTGISTGTGTAPRYTGTRALTRLTLTGHGHGHSPLDLATFGETTPLPGDDVVRLTDATRGAYRKVVVRGDRLIGGILLGDLGAVGELARTWEGDEPLPSSPLSHLLGGS
ncbi:FAD-dependent oxidoreductase [Streptomyces sp. 21So2-11]|uniref:NAD(P)/FAD-dependent oxidoreductase n=1 Tax=Streptomyces sp. 21So2-11 TaxID=3144408 RepID=UPI00321C2CEF